MSLINKMLQDLDARGGGAGAVDAPELKAVPAGERDRRPLMLAGAVLAALALCAAGWYGWRVWQAQPAPQPAAPVAALQNTPPPVHTAAVHEQVAAPAPAPVVATTPVVPVAESSPVAEAPAAAVAPVAPRKAMAPEEQPPRKAPRGVPPPAAEAAPANGTVTRDTTPRVMAENTYRRALVALQEGRVGTALADLDKAVEIDPRNDAARQTYVSLLLENKRTDDAIRQLRLALGIDPRQPGLAMVLARLQLEKGGPALQTLLTTLPYAGNSADYRGFLAGVLQREQRHDEAVQHYREALRLSPNSGVWWMGLGISLQAGQHLPEAREAFTRARAGTGLTPELQAFIDRKLEQLSR